MVKHCDLKNVCGLKQQVFSALRYMCMQPEPTSECGLKLLVYADVRN
jgi:hypothetical protein